MVDGDIEGSIDEVPETEIALKKSLLLRVLCRIPPENADAQHYAPVFQYERGTLNHTVASFIRGFRYYWQESKDNVLLQA
jgi:hypothetical protein